MSCAISSYRGATSGLPLVFAYSRTEAASSRCGAPWIFDLDRHVANLGREVGIALEREQAHGFAHHHEACRCPPGRIEHHRSDDFTRGRFFVFDLERTAVGVGVAEYPATVDADQVSLDQDLAQRQKVGLFTGELIVFQVGDQIGDRITAFAHLGDSIGVEAVLDSATVFRTRVGLRRQDRSVGAEPLDGVERPLRRLLGLLDPLRECRRVGQARWLLHRTTAESGKGQEQQAETNRCGTQASVDHHGADFSASSHASEQPGVSAKVCGIP